jgi:hypothetical protein
MTTQTTARLSKLCVIALAAITFTVARGGAQSSPSATAQDAKPFDQQQKLAELNKQIEGQESKPAGEVFKNIQMFKIMPAKRLLLVMGAYSRALGVDCTYCHTVDQWDKDDKPTKQTARDMMKMVISINTDQLKNMKNIRADASVSCSTCHRGQPHPDSRLPEAKPKAGSSGP